MASNKNQHFVPRCYLRPFTLGGANAAINILNLDRLKVIQGAPVKHQCSGDYFYGKNSQLEKALQATERAYAGALVDILTPGYRLTEPHRTLLCRFWLLQHLRTEAASRRAVEMTVATSDVIGAADQNFRLGIKEAVQMAMRTFVEAMDLLDDLKICLVKNRTDVPFVTSDDPAILTNRWHLHAPRARGRSFGLRSAGSLTFLPLSPSVLCLGYDGDVYSVAHQNGWMNLSRDADVHAFNEHQFLNCRANVFFHDAVHGQLVRDAFTAVSAHRPNSRHVIHYAVLDRTEGDFQRFRVINRADADEHAEALIHTQVVHPHPRCWPQQIGWRPGGVVFTNDTGLGYVRRAFTATTSTKPFRKQATR